MKSKWMLSLIVWFTGFTAQAAMDHAQMSVWVNEAIVETYTYQYHDYLERQKVFAHYFTAEAWIAYMKALAASKLIDEVKKNKYSVSAVATLPPTLTVTAPQHWKAVMPLLVRYKNPQQEQTQFLEVTLGFTEAPSNQGVRGLVITSIQTKKSSPPCVCENFSGISRKNY